MQYLIILSLLFSTFLLPGCNKDEDKTFDKQTTDAGEFSRKGERRSENKTALEMEAALNQRYRFYKALQGTYLGVTQTQEGQSKIQIDLYLFHPPFPTDPNRTRTIEEVAHDLTNLSMKAYINQWTPSSSPDVPSTSIGCIAEGAGIAIDMNTGEISIVSDKCENIYPLFLSDSTLITSEALTNLTSSEIAQEKEQAINIAKAVWEGRLNVVSQLRGEVKSKNIPQPYELLVTRVSE